MSVSDSRSLNWSQGRTEKDGRTIMVALSGNSTDASWCEVVEARARKPPCQHIHHPCHPFNRASQHRSVSRPSSTYSLAFSLIFGCLRYNYRRKRTIVGQQCKFFCWPIPRTKTPPKLPASILLGDSKCDVTADDAANDEVIQMCPVVVRNVLKNSVGLTRSFTARQCYRRVAKWCRRYIDNILTRGHVMTLEDDLCMFCQGLPIGKILAF